VAGENAVIVIPESVQYLTQIKNDLEKIASE
jgi:hypothetical protein